MKIMVGLAHVPFRSGAARLTGCLVVAALFTACTDDDPAAGDVAGARASLLFASAVDFDAPFPMPDGEEGASVDIAADGTRVIVGVPGGCCSPWPAVAGSAVVYRLDAGRYVPEAVLERPAPLEGIHFGSSVRLNDDGTRAFVGTHPQARARDEAVVVFDRSGETWTHSATIGAGNIISDVTALGDRMVVRDSPWASVSAAHVFEWTGSRWRHEAALGAKALIDDNADWAAVQEGGRVILYARTGRTWARERGLGRYDGFDLSDDGEILLLWETGGSEVRVLRRSGSRWNEDGTIPVSTGTAMSGTRILSGGRQYDYVGGAWVAGASLPFWSSRFALAGADITFVRGDRRDLPPGVREAEEYHWYHGSARVVTVSGGGTVDLPFEPMYRARPYAFFGRRVSASDGAERVAVSQLDGTFVYARGTCGYAIETVIPSAWRRRGLDFSSAGDRLALSGQAPPRIYVRSGTTWSVEAELRPGGVGGDGLEVSLSRDGAVALVDNRFVFTRTGAVWTERTELPAGSTVSVMSSDGALIARPSGGYSVAVYGRSGDSWAEVSSVSVPAAPYFSLGKDLAIAGDGSRLFVSWRDEADPSEQDELLIFHWDSSSWVLEHSLLSSNFGRIDVSPDGAILTVSAKDDVEDVWGEDHCDINKAHYCGGGVRVYARRGTTWSAPTWLGSRTWDDQFGNALDVSTDGRHLLVGAVLGDGVRSGDTGRAHLFALAAVCDSDADCTDGTCSGGFCCGATCGACATGADCPVGYSCAAAVCVMDAVDAGAPTPSMCDAGVLDAGTSLDGGTMFDAGDVGVSSDAGADADGGTSVDAGADADGGAAVDAGATTDAGPPDTGVDDSGVLDAGRADAAPDAGDTGSPTHIDTGAGLDAAVADADSRDAGTDGAAGPPDEGGCSVSGAPTPGALLPLAFALALHLASRRRFRKR